MPVKEVRGLFQALTEGGWGGLIGPTGIYKLHILENRLADKFTPALQDSGVKTNLRHRNKN